MQDGTATGKRPFYVFLYLGTKKGFFKTTCFKKNVWEIKVVFFSKKKNNQLFIIEVFFSIAHS